LEAVEAGASAPLEALESAVLVEAAASAEEEPVETGTLLTRSLREGVAVVVAQHLCRVAASSLPKPAEAAAVAAHFRESRGCLARAEMVEATAAMVASAATMA